MTEKPSEFYHLKCKTCNANYIERVKNYTNGKYAFCSIKCLAKFEFQPGRESERERIIEIINNAREKHIHPKQNKLDYYDKWESSGCNMCFINRKIKEILKELELND